jgi:hypothetical protein
MPEITIDGLSGAIANECRSYGKAAEKSMKKVIRTVSKEAAEKLKQDSPKDTGRYRKGWRSKVSEGSDTATAIIHNATDAPLTHLLEYGHALPQGGRARAYPHIKPVEDWANEEAVKRLEGELHDLD